jgi:hypothetical protein
MFISRFYPWTRQAIHDVSTDRLEIASKKARPKKRMPGEQKKKDPPQEGGHGDFRVPRSPEIP